MSKIAVVDEDLPRAIGDILEGLGWQVLDVRDIGLRKTDDDKIAQFARGNKATLFSGDWGFANILNFPPSEYHGIVILDFPNEMSTKAIANETKKALEKIPLHEFKSNLIIISPGKVRIREE